MIDHVDIRASDLEASERFYDTVLPVLGRRRVDAEGYLEWGDFAVHPAGEDSLVTRRLDIGFAAATRDLLAAFRRAGTEAGYRADGPALLDPDGNRIEAITAPEARTPGAIVHLGIRVADLAAARRFYETVAPYAGIRAAGDTEFAGDGDSFSLIAGEEPTENLHMAFAASDHATVDAFHRAAIAAGYRDNGAPGPRPIYDAGYYGAFVLDPDGNNIEAVNQSR